MSDELLDAGALTSADVGGFKIVGSAVDKTEVASATPGAITERLRTTSDAAGDKPIAVQNESTDESVAIRAKADIRYRDHAGADATRNEVVMFADFRVFIMGVEVTDWVTESIQVSRSLNGQENQCTFTLDNTNDRFIMRAENFGALRKTKTGSYNYNQESNPEKLFATGLQYENKTVTESDISAMRWITDAPDTATGKIEYEEVAKKELYRYKAPMTLFFSKTADEMKAAAAASTSTAAASPTPVSTSSGAAVAATPVSKEQVAAFNQFAQDGSRLGIKQAQDIQSGKLKVTPGVKAPSTAQYVAAEDRIIAKTEQRNTKNAAHASAVADASSVASGTMVSSESGSDTSYNSLKSDGYSETLVAAHSVDNVTSLPKYDLSVGACVISLHDEVRVFFANPNHDPMEDGVRQWMPVFTGVVSSVPVHNSRVDGVSTLQISCSDVRYLLRKMRVTANIQSRNQVATYIQFSDAVGLFQDAAFFGSGAETGYESLASQLSYRQVTRALLCGDTAATILEKDHENMKNGGKTNNTVSGTITGSDDPWLLKVKVNSTEVTSGSGPDVIGGVGNFSLGFEVQNPDWTTLKSTANGVAIMEGWQDLVEFGIKQDWYSDKEVSKIGAGTRPIDYSISSSTISGSPYSVLNGFVHYLFPAGSYDPSGVDKNLLGIRNLIERAIVNPMGDVSWTNRLDMLTQVSDTIDYKFYVNGIGDFCFEFPMYDFTPNYFGKYAHAFVVSDSVKSDEHNDEGDGNVVTALKVTGGYKDIDQSNGAAAGNQVVSDQKYSVWIKSDWMASKYGIVPEEYQIPWALDVWSMKKGDADEDAVRKNTLTSFGVIEFYRRIAAMSSMSADICYNPFIMPNRPFLNKLLRRIGLVNTSSMTINIDGTLATSVETYFVRKARQNDKAQQVYHTITGYANTPFGYTVDGLKLFTDAVIWDIRTDYGIEIINPSISKYSDALKGMSAGDIASRVNAYGKYQANTGKENNLEFAYTGTAKSRQNSYYTWAANNQKLAAKFKNIISRHGSVDPAIAFGILCGESGMNPQMRNQAGSGAIGIAQFMPSTLKSMGLSVADLQAGGKYGTVSAQLDLLGKYLSTTGVRLNDPRDVCAAIYMPGADRDSVFSAFSSSSSNGVRQIVANPKYSSQNSGINSLADYMIKVQGIVPTASTATVVNAASSTTSTATPAKKPGIQPKGTATSGKEAGVLTRLKKK